MLNGDVLDEHEETIIQFGTSVAAGSPQAPRSFSCAAQCAFCVYLQRCALVFTALCASLSYKRTALPLISAVRLLQLALCASYYKRFALPVMSAVRFF